MKPLAPALAELYAKRPTVIKPGLRRIEAALAALGKDRLFGPPQVLVGGTNGKGSTIGFLWQLAGKLGKRPGLFTSPHLARFEERIQVYGAPVTEALLLGRLADLRTRLPAALYDDLSFFEVNTLLAFDVFRRLGAGVDLLEVGLGGRWDSTNASDPGLSVITSIGMDHQQYLGDTSAKIAFEKAGIMRQGRPVLWGGDLAGDADAVKTIRELASEKGARLYELGRHFGAEGDAIALRVPFASGWSLPWPRKAASWPEYLRRNFVLAVAAAAHLLEGEADAESRLRAAVLSLDEPETPVAPSLRGRFEAATLVRSGRSHALLFDVCHNVDGARAFRSALEDKGLARSDRPLPGLIAILADKDTAGILDVLRPVLSPLRLFATTSERTWSRQDLAERHRDLPFFTGFEAAWLDYLRESDAKRSVSEPAVVCGSVHAVGHVMTELGLLS